MAEMNPITASTIRDQGRAEQSFRQLIVKDLSNLLSTQTPTDLKIVVVVLLIAALAISFIISIFLIHSLCFIWLRQPSYNPIHYVIIITILVLACTGLFIPLVLRADTIEHTIRLEESFQKATNARRIATRRPQ